MTMQPSDFYKLANLKDNPFRSNPTQESDLTLCADKNRADQFAEELIEFTLPVAAWRQSGHSLNHGHAL